MMGSILAGTEESPGEKIIYQGRQYVAYRGMGSLAAMQAGQGSRERYGQDNVAPDDLVPQGIEGMVPYAGHRAEGHDAVLRRPAAGHGLLRLPHARRNCEPRGRFVRITPAGVAEGHAHDVKITKEAPNYRAEPQRTRRSADSEART